MVFDEAFKYLTLETTVRILDGPDAAELNLRLFRVMQSVPDEAAPLSWFGQTLSPTEFLDAMIAEDRDLRVRGQPRARPYRRRSAGVSGHPLAPPAFKAAGLATATVLLDRPAPDVLAAGSVVGDARTMATAWGGTTVAVPEYAGALVRGWAGRWLLPEEWACDVAATYLTLRLEAAERLTATSRPGRPTGS
ncbi:MAG: hypothetical protein QOC74_3042 [Pseudonocardiales bacterium]|nr:hypothetical protein [Pseudonocardiales bacterium]